MNEIKKERKKSGSYTPKNNHINKLIKVVGL